ncbi:MAG: hypothetical protein HKP09_03415, partial [Enterobacterales bacterium]|nr:hypothetical protein [Enterobacterales bacterium]
MKLSKATFQVVIICLSLLLNTGVFAKVDAAEQKKLLAELKAGKIPQFTPDEHHIQASQLITHILKNYHYKKP